MAKVSLSESEWATVLWGLDIAVDTEDSAIDAYQPEIVAAKDRKWMNAGAKRFARNKARLEKVRDKIASSITPPSPKETEK